jgi:uncharacterized protein (TIGR02145 family)
MRYSYSRSIFNLLIIGFISLLVFNSCDELEPVNPADPAYTLKPPTLVSTQAITDIQIDLAWQDNDEHTEEFVIQRKSDSTQYINVTIVNKEVLIYSDTTCVLDTKYNYVILSKVEANTSNYSNAYTCNTSFPPPTDIMVTPASEVATHISWTDNSTYEDGYRVERDSGSGFEPVTDLIANSTEYTDNGLEYGIDYTYRVAGFTVNNSSEWNTSIAMNTQLTAPTNLVTEAFSNTEIELNWSDNCNNEIGYKIEREYWDEPSDYHSGFVEIADLDADVTHYIDTNVYYNVKFIYRIVGYAEDDMSDWAISSPTLSSPSAPEDLTATVINDSEITLNWVHSSYYVDGFIVERNSGSGFIQIAEVGYDIGQDVIAFTDSDLIMDTGYIYRIACFDEVNVSTYSETVTTSIIAPLVDYDGNVYATVMIGDQIWMAENLKVQHYQNGATIPKVTSNTEWASLSSGAYCIYGNLSMLYFGYLYNYYIIEDSQNIAPAGWHVATDEDWQELEIFLGMGQSEADSSGWRGSDEGTKLKLHTGWFGDGSTNVGNNESGFAALGGGYRGMIYGQYHSETYRGVFWTATGTDTEESWSRTVGWNIPTVERSKKNKRYGYSIRCVKD